MSERHVYDITVREIPAMPTNRAPIITERRHNLGLGDATEFLRSCMRGANYKPMQITITKKIPQ